MIRKYRILSLGKDFYRVQERKYLLGIIPWYPWTGMMLPCESISYADKIIPRGKKIKIVTA